MLLTRQHAISSLFLFSRKIFTYTLNKNVNEPSNKPFGNVVTYQRGLMRRAHWSKGGVGKSRPVIPRVHADLAMEWSKVQVRI